MTGKSPNPERVHKRKQAILQLLRHNQSKGLPPPSIREFAKAAGISSTCVTRCYLHKMAAEGLITTTPGISRGTVLAQTIQEQAIVRIPLRGILRDHRIVWVSPEDE
ncbi:MAG: hypothetical protein KF821_01730 [Anaerolineales bacterium]|jgi:DNA-binding transcriptional regulator YhcF (GntR family)|nr:hypothetical protein [Anaerolineales bacterium]